MKNKLLSLQCSGDSIEKVLTLYYFALKSNPEFYENYNVELFYGNNLPKKVKSINAHGSIGFYTQYYSKLPFFPKCTKEYLYKNIDSILEKLVKEKHLTVRVAYKLKNDPDRYWEYLRNLPFSYIYPEFIDNLIKKSQQALGFYKISSVMLERNYMSIINQIQSERYRYSIYSLDLNGKIGKHNITNEKKNKLVHLYSNLSKSPVLSGNSAVLITAIARRISTKTIVGYREHKRSPRPNRNFALSKLAENRESVLEPKIDKFNVFFNDIDINLSEEERANEAYAKAYLTYIEEVYKNIEL